MIMRLIDIERFDNIGCGAALKYLPHSKPIAFGAHGNERDTGELRVYPQGLAKGKSVHDGHVQIAKNQIRCVFR